MQPRTMSWSSCLSKAKFEDLSFLDRVFPDFAKAKQDRYTRAHWLLNDFDSPDWKCKFGRFSASINWRIPLGASDELLTDPRHSELLRTFKCWLVLSTHADVQGGALWGPQMEFRRFFTVVDWIDFFLVRADEFGLAKNALANLSRDDLTAALSTIAASRRKSDGIYEFSVRLSALLRKIAGSVASAEVRKLVKDNPFLASDIPAASDRVTDLTDSEIVAARAMLWSQGAYVSRGGDGNHRWFVPLSTLVPQMYSGTIRGSRGKRMPTELNLIPDDRTVRECAAAPVMREAGTGLTKHRFNDYERLLREFGLLANVGLPIPLASLRTLQREDAVSRSVLRETGRYRTPSPDTVFFALREAIEFVLIHGENIVAGYLTAAALAHSLEMPLPHAVRQALKVPGSRVEAMQGIVCWTARDLYPSGPSRNAAMSGADYYARLRSNAGLWDMVRVLYGATQVIVGALTARRLSELIQLDATDCIDKSRTYLVFGNAKSGVAGLRDTLARPVPPIAVRAIELIQRLQRSMLSASQVDELGLLFAPPSARGIGLVQPSAPVYLSSLDLFYDYIEMPKDAEGRRFYLRQHQLRRFFAMVFFWSNSFGGMDTLREFLGHTDVNHLYRYITESTPGEVLRGVKADWATEALRTQVTAADALADLVERRYGTREFKLLDSDDVADYIDGLLATGKVRIEPEFLDGRGTYRIAVHVLASEAVA